MTVQDLIECLMQHPRDALVVGPLPNSDPDWHSVVTLSPMNVTKVGDVYVPAAVAPDEKPLPAVLIKT